MESVEDKRITATGPAMKWYDGHAEQVPMHPDDFSALLAWVTAKRFHEHGTGELFREKPDYFRLPG